MPRSRYEAASRSSGGRSPSLRWRIDAPAAAGEQRNRCKSPPERLRNTAGKERRGRRGGVMTPQPRDEAREERIHDEILVDAYGPEKQASSWYSYLEETLIFPFLARCVVERPISPLQLGDEVEIVAMGPESECR